VVAFSKAIELDNIFAPKSSFIASDLIGLAQAKVKLGQLNEAERNFKEALQLFNNNRNDEGITTALGNLAELNLEKQQWAEAESLAREALALAEKVGRQELIAGDCHRLAEALLKQSGRSNWQFDLQEALSLSRRAVEIFTRLRQQNNLQSAQETLAEIERAIHE